MMLGGATFSALSDAERNPQSRMRSALSDVFMWTISIDLVRVPPVCHHGPLARATRERASSHS